MEQSDSDLALTVTPNHAGLNGPRSPGLKRMRRETRWEGAELDEENGDEATVTRLRQTGTQMSLGCCLDTSSYHSLLLDLLKLVFHDQNMCLGCWQAKYESN